jgi:hypothetical protein
MKFWFIENKKKTERRRRGRGSEGEGKRKNLMPFIIIFTSKHIHPPGNFDLSVFAQQSRPEVGFSNHGMYYIYHCTPSNQQANRICLIAWTVLNNYKHSV